MNMLKLFQVGDRIGGFCNGYFGRDDYENKTCVMVTIKYAVFQYDEGYGAVLNFQESLTKEKIEEWKKEYRE